MKGQWLELAFAEDDGRTRIALGGKGTHLD